MAFWNPNLDSLSHCGGAALPELSKRRPWPGCFRGQSARASYGTKRGGGDFGFVHENRRIKQAVRDCCVEAPHGLFLYGLEAINRSFAFLLSCQRPRSRPDVLGGGDEYISLRCQHCGMPNASLGWWSSLCTACCQRKEECKYSFVPWLFPCFLRKNVVNYSIKEVKSLVSREIRVKIVVFFLDWMGRNGGWRLPIGEKRGIPGKPT